MDLNFLSTHYLYSIIIVFTRFGAMVMLMPGLSESYVNVRARLLLVISISVILSPMVIEIVKVPTTGLGLFTELMIEIFIGIFFGCLVKIILSATHTSGLITANQSGLGSAMLFDPSAGAQGAIVGNFISMIVITLLLVLDMHHIFFKALIDSYQVFPPGKFVPVGEFSEMVTRTFADSFTVAIKFSSPQIVVGLLLMIGGGVLARLMPSLQIFFLITPIQMILSFVVLMFTFTDAIEWYFGYLNEFLLKFVAS